MPTPGAGDAGRLGRAGSPPGRGSHSLGTQADHLAKEIARLVRRCDRNTRDALAGSPASARKLAERVRALARLCQTLDAHLRGNQAMEYRRQAEEMVRRATLAADAFAADQYRAAAQSLESQAAVCEELARTRERFHAEVARILAALSNLRSRIVSMLASPTAAIGQIDRTADELADLDGASGHVPGQRAPGAAASLALKPFPVREAASAGTWPANGHPRCSWAACRPRCRPSAQGAHLHLGHQRLDLGTGAEPGAEDCRVRRARGHSPAQQHLRRQAAHHPQGQPADEAIAGTHGAHQLNRRWLRVEELRAVGQHGPLGAE